jgi:transglutaminase-like putative cysteine protease
MREDSLIIASTTSDYLGADPVVQSDHPRIKAAAKAIAAHCATPLETIKALFEWVRDDVSHSNDAGRPEVTCTSLEVLDALTGACYAKSHLLTALLRSQGIPCGFCYQVNTDEGFEGTLHGLNALYLQETKNWIRLDPRGNTSGCRSPAVLDLSNEDARLAFPELPFLDNKIHAAPLPEVVHKLKEHEHRNDLWKDLPQAPANPD